MYIKLFGFEILISVTRTNLPRPGEYTIFANWDGKIKVVTQNGAVLPRAIALKILRRDLYTDKNQIKNI